MTIRLLAILLLAVGLSAAELSLTPTQVTLVDGRIVAGQLAAELDQHLIVYSPGLGTLASFRKEFVASYTRDKQTVKVSAPKKLGPEDLLRLDWNGWPDAAPEKGGKPAYTTETWDKPKRLVVWSKPGVSGKFNEAANWTVYGAAVEGATLWSEDTDVLLPASDKPYVIAAGSGGDNRFEVLSRHLTAESGSGITLQGGMPLGNLWVRQGGRYSHRFGVGFRGSKHTFCRVEGPAVRRAKGTGIEWLEVKEGRAASSLGQYVITKKEAGGSVEFLGVISSNDKFFVESGIAVIGPGCSVMSSNRSPDRVHPGATLRLMSGAILGKHIQKSKGEAVWCQGTIEVGTKERPITEDAFIALPLKDFSGVMDGRGVDSLDKPFDVAVGFNLYEQGSLRVTSADPTKARLVFCYFSRETGPDSLDFNINPGHLNSRAEIYKRIPRRIDICLRGDTSGLDGVLFEDCYKGGIRLKDLKQKDAWKHVFYGTRNGGKPEELVALWADGHNPSGWIEEMTKVLAELGETTKGAKK